MSILRHSNGKGDVWWKTSYKCRVLIILVSESFKMLTYMYPVLHIYRHHDVLGMSYRHLRGYYCYNLSLPNMYAQSQVRISFCLHFVIVKPLNHFLPFLFNSINPYFSIYWNSCGVWVLVLQSSGNQIWLWSWHRHR